MGFEQMLTDLLMLLMSMDLLMQPMLKVKLMLLMLKDLG